MDRGDDYRSVWRSLMDLEFEQRFVDAGAVRTRYARAGSRANPTVLCLHGTGGCWETYAANIGPLSARFDTIAVDMLGCGLTDKPDRPYEIRDLADHVLAFLDALGVERTSMIGITQGSWAACRIAHDAPERVDRLVLTIPGGLLDMPREHADSVLSGRSFNDPTWDNIASGVTAALYDPAMVLDDIVAVRQQVTTRHPNPRRLLTLFEEGVGIRNLLTEAEWKGVTAPTLVVQHVDKDDFYLETSRRIVELMPNATGVELPGATHWPPFEQPDAFNALAIDFLTGSRP